MIGKSYLSLDLDKISFADSTVLEYSINLSKKILKFKVDSVFYELDVDGSGGLIGEVEFCFSEWEIFSAKTETENGIERKIGSYFVKEVLEFVDDNPNFIFKGFSTNFEDNWTEISIIDVKNISIYLCI